MQPSLICLPPEGGYDGVSWYYAVAGRVRDEPGWGMVRIDSRSYSEFSDVYIARMARLDVIA